MYCSREGALLATDASRRSNAMPGRTRGQLFALIATLILVAISAKPSAAAWGYGTIVTSSSQNQDGSRSIPDGSQGVYMTWVDHSGTYSAVRVQRLTHRGLVAPGWPAGGKRVTSATLAGDQFQPAIVASNAGGVIVVWSDRRAGSTWDIYAQRFSATGVATWDSTGGVAVCTATSDQTNASITSDLAGGCFLAWDDYRNGYIDIYTQWIDLNGVRATHSGTQWPVNGARACGANYYQYNSQVGFWGTYLVVSWVDERYIPWPISGPRRIFANFLTLDGAQTVTDGFAVSTMTSTESDDERYPLVLPTTAPDSAVIVFESHGPGDYGWGIYAQRIAASGSLAWSGGKGLTLCDTHFDQSNNWQSGAYAVADLPSRSYSVTWQDHRDNTSGWQIYAGRFDYNGATSWVHQLTTNVDNTLDNWYPVIAPGGSGGVIVVWQSYRPDGGYSWIDACAIASDGVRSWAPPYLTGIDGTSIHLSGATVSADGLGGAIVTRQAPAPYASLLAQLVTASGVVGPTFPAPDAITNVGRITCTTASEQLTWTAPADGLGNACAQYAVRYSTNPITDAATWASATVFPNSMVPATPGTTESLWVTGLTSCIWYYFAVKPVDADGLQGGLSNFFAAKPRCTQNGPCNFDIGLASRRDVPDPGEGGTQSSHLQIHAIGPNPAVTGVSIELVVPGGDRERLSLGVFDLVGRRVATIHAEAETDGLMRGEWNLRDDKGPRVARGVYWVRAAVGAQATAKAVIVR